MNKRRPDCKKKPLLLAWLIVLFHTGAIAIAQTEGLDYPLELPEIIDNVDIDLGNIFQTRLSGSGDVQADQHRALSLNSEPLQLVGILILGEKKFAWIKTHDNRLAELEKGQQVPGSSYRIEHIFEGSVALVNVETCQQDMICKPAHILALN